MKLRAGTAWLSISVSLLFQLAADTPLTSRNGLTVSAVSPAQPEVERLTHEAQQLRIEGAPGWRTSALKLIEKAVNLHGGVSLDELRQEAIAALSTPELAREEWRPPNSICVLDVDIANEKYVVGAPDGTIVGRSLSDHRPFWKAPGNPPKEIRWLGHSPDGLAFVWARGSDQIQVWGQSMTNQALWVSPSNEVRSVAINSVGTRLALIRATLPHGGGKLWLAPLRGLEFQKETQVPEGVIAAEWAPDDVRLGALLENPPRLVVYETGLETIPIEISFPWKARSLGWMPTARGMVIGGEHGVDLVDLTSGELQHFPGSTNISRLVLNESGSIAVSADANGIIQLWDVAARQLLTTVKERADRLELSPDGKRLASIQTDTGTASIWSVATARGIVQFVPEERSPLFPGQPDGLQLKESAVVLDTGSNAAIQLLVPVRPISALRSQNGRWVRVQLQDGRRMDWNLDRLREQLSAIGIPW